MADWPPIRRMPGPRSRDTGPVPAIIGRSAAVTALRRQIARVAPTEATVLILGERGTGKELVARAIQEQSRRRDRPFVTVNCAAVPTELLASELFGHERGAFTGATERAIGLLRAAHGGTLFLDEVGDLPLPAQAMLLRFLEEGDARPVGSTTTVTVDARIIAATNKDLEPAVARGEFRADLLDRLREFVIDVPPLRERHEDMPLLVDHFVAAESRRHGRQTPRLSPAAGRALHAHAWPGNVRELKHVISSAVILADDGAIREADLGFARRVGPVAPMMEQAESPAGSASTRAAFTDRQREAARMAENRGIVRRADLIARFGVSTEAARMDLACLVRAGVLRRSGAGRGTVYRPV